MRRGRSDRGRLLAGSLCLLWLAVGVPAPGAEAGEALRAVVGSPFPPFQLTDVEDETFSSKQLAGYPTILYFTHNMCHYCTQIIGFLMQAQEEGYEEIGLRIVTINVWARDRRLIERYRDRFGFTFPMLAGNVKSLLAAYEVNYVPIIVFVRRDGTVHRIFHHYILKSDFKANLEEITQSR